jgi:uncharacterized membrane protein YdcZ (DUF606 family)
MSLSTGRKVPNRNESRAAGSVSRSASWAWGLIGATLPIALVAVLTLTALATPLGVTTTGPMALVLYVAVAAPLVAAMVIGYRGWAREHEQAALRAALFSAWALVVGTALLLLA